MAYTKQLKFDRKTLRFLSILLQYVDMEELRQKERSLIEIKELSKAIKAIKNAAFDNSLDGRKSRADQKSRADLAELAGHVIKKYNA